jgi:outer membrane protein TolC
MNRTDRVKNLPARLRLRATGAASGARRARGVLGPHRTIATVSAMLLMMIVTTTFAQENAADGVRRIALDEYLSLVEANSLRLRNARTDRSLAEAQERLVRSQVYPTIAGQAGYTRNFLDIEQAVPALVDGTAIPGSSLGLDPSKNYYQLVRRTIDVNQDNEFSFGLSLQQKLFDLNVFRALEASRQFIDFTGATYEAQRHGLLTEAKRLYFQVLLLEEVLQVRRSSQEIAYDNYLETQRRLDNGIASPLEVLRAEVNWKITEPDTSQAERNLNVALQNLKTFAGLDQSEAIALAGSFDDYPELPSFEGAFARRNERPNYRALVNRRRLQELNVAAERAKFYPSLAASLSYGWQGSDDGFDLSGGTDVLTAGLNLTIPIFYGGSRFASMERARLELSQAGTAIAMEDERILTELETLRLTLEESRLRIDSAEQTLSTAERAYEVSETSLDSGLATQLELKDARVSLEQARLNYVSAVFDYLSAYFDWQLATGRGDRGV